MTDAEKRKHRVCFTGHRPEKLTRHECQVIKDLELWMSTRSSSCPE